jgi:hypothetical protein
MRPTERRRRCRARELMRISTLTCAMIDAFALEPRGSKESMSRT